MPVTLKGSTLMTDTVTKEVRKKIMQSVRSTQTKLENRFSSSLWQKGLRYRKNVRDLPGKPDIAIKKYRAVIFIDSCFWHGCEMHFVPPKSNVEYWSQKIKSNIDRDKQVTKYYKENGWNILRIWEHQLKENYSQTIDMAIVFILQARNR